MKVGIDITPLEDKQHSVRGSGFYIRYLKSSLQKHSRGNQYIFYTRKKGIPSIADIVHIPYFEPFFLTLPIKDAKRTIVTVHDLIPLVFPSHFPSGITGSLKWKIQRFLLASKSAVITDSKCSKKDIVRLTGISDKKIYVVPLAADEQFRMLDLSEKNMKVKISNLKGKYNLPEKFALYVGDVTWNKNVPRIVQSCQRENIPLVMIGKALTDREYDRNNPWNKDRMLVEELIKSNGRVVRLGFVPAEDLILIYNLAVVFVMPSLYEGFGLPILEAMQCGCPVVTSKEGSLPEVAGDVAYYVDPNDIDSITEGIKNYFSDQGLREQASKKSLAHAAKFNWRETATQTIEVYEKVYKNF